MGVVNPEYVKHQQERAKQYHLDHREARAKAKHDYYYSTPTWSRRNSYYKATYGITIYQFNQMLRDQGEACYICHVKGNDLHVDHDHATDRVRGLLCWRCNKGLGVYRDNIPALRRAVEYLERPFDGRMVIPDRHNFIQDLAAQVEKEGLVKVGKIVAMTPQKLQETLALLVQGAEDRHRLEGLEK